MFDKAAAFNQDLCGWDVSNSASSNDDYYTITYITVVCTNGAICGENGTNSCGTDWRKNK